LKFLRLYYLQFFYGQNVIHVNNADDKIDNSEQEKDLGRTAEQNKIEEKEKNKDP